MPFINERIQTFHIIKPEISILKQTELESRSKEKYDHSSNEICRILLRTYLTSQQLVTETVLRR